jgi:prepilin-type N-terminal cleavage/methylation domain-containing protein
MTRSRPSRRGFTLIEVVLGVGAVSIVLGLCAGLLHVLLRLDRTGRAHLVETATVGRLARQFRQDVHAAAVTKPDRDDGGPAATLELTPNSPDGRRVVYAASPSAVVRTQHRGAVVERRETYALPSCRDPRFLVHAAEGKVWASLRLPRDVEGVAGTGPKRPRHALQIDALAGRDHRLTPASSAVTEKKETMP